MAGFSYTDIIGPLILAGGQLLSGSLANSANNKTRNQNNDFTAEQAALNRQNQLDITGIQADAATFVDPVAGLMKAYQNYIGNSLSAGDRQSQAYQVINNSVAKALLR